MQFYREEEEKHASKRTLDRLARATGCRCSVLRLLQHIRWELIVPFDILHGLHIGMVKRQILLTVEEISGPEFKALMEYIHTHAVRASLWRV